MANGTIRTWNKVPLYRCDSDGFFDATRMCSACGDKRFCEYDRLKRSKDYCLALQEELSSRAKEDGQVPQVVRIIYKGCQSGTWIHPRLAVDLARWLCPKFAVWIDSWILDSISITPQIIESESNSMEGGARLFHNQKKIVNETDLHYSIVSWIRRFHPRAIVAPGLGELQDTESKRKDAWAKGYVSGQPDLLILNRHTRFNGLALELKHPGYTELKVSKSQQIALNCLRSENWRVIASNDYDQICFYINEYMNELNPMCDCCSLSFPTKKTLLTHINHEKSHKRRRGEEAPQQTQIIDPNATQ